MSDREKFFGHFNPTISFKEGAFTRPQPQLPSEEDEIFYPRPFTILTGSSSEPLAQDVANELGKTSYISLDPRKPYFEDGEPNIQIPENVRGHNVYIVHSTSPSFADHSVSDHLQELVGIVRAARLGSAHEITAVIPYFGFSRGDKKDRPRVPVMAALAARQIEKAGADRMIVVDIHSDQFQGFVEIPVDIIYSLSVFEPILREEGFTDSVFVSPDAGGLKRARKYRERLGAKASASIDKKRDPYSPDKVEVMDLIGNVKGERVTMVDDMIGTASTLVQGAEALINKYGATEVNAVAAHGIFAGNALDLITQSPISRVFVTDTIKPRPEVENHPKITVVKMGGFIAQAIDRTQRGKSLSEILE